MTGAGDLSTDLSYRDDQADEAGGFVWKSDVLDAKNNLEAKMAATRFDVHNCAALTKEEKANFAAFYDSWRKFYCLNDTGTCDVPDASIFFAGTQMDTVQKYEAELFQWQRQVKGRCPLNAPSGPPPTARDPIAGYLMWGAAIVGGVLLLNVLGYTGLPRLFPRGRR